jgi:hypothetical protein
MGSDLAAIWSAGLQQVQDELGAAVHVPLVAGQPTRDGDRLVIHFTGAFAAMSKYLDKHRDEIQRIFSTVAGGALGWTLGTAAGVHRFGRRSPRGGGSFAATLTGSLIGTLATGAAAWAAYELSRPSASHPEYQAYVTAAVLGPILPALGAGVGYLLSAPSAVPVPGLVHYSPETGVGLGLPLVSVANSSGSSTVNVALAAGSF